MGRRPSSVETRTVGAGAGSIPRSAAAAAFASNVRDPPPFATTVFPAMRLRLVVRSAEEGVETTTTEDVATEVVVAPAGCTISDAGEGTVGERGLMATDAADESRGGREDGVAGVYSRGPDSSLE